MRLVCHFAFHDFSGLCHHQFIGHRECFGYHQCAKYEIVLNNRKNSDSSDCFCHRSPSVQKSFSCRRQHQYSENDTSEPGRRPIPCRNGYNFHCIGRASGPSSSLCSIGLSYHPPQFRAGTRNQANTCMDKTQYNTLILLHCS